MIGVTSAFLLLGVMLNVKAYQLKSCPRTDPMDTTEHLPHPSDCHFFLTCDHGQPVVQECPPGLEFNPKLQVCDWPYEAGCVKGCQTLPVLAASHWEPATCSNGISSVGSACSLQCDSGYELKGSSQIVCVQDGWNGTGGLNEIPSCKTPECIGYDVVEIVNTTIPLDVNIVFVMDQSGSIGLDNYKKGLDFLKDFIRAFPLSETRSAGLIIFDDKSQVSISLSESSTQDFIKRIDTVGYSGGGTNIAGALTLALNEIKSHAVHNSSFVVLITDGVSSTDPVAAAEALKSAGNTLFCIGIAQDRMPVLETLASKTKQGDAMYEYFLHVKTYDGLQEIGKYLISTESREVIKQKCDPQV